MYASPQRTHVINQVTIIIVTEVKTVNSCIVVSPGESDHKLVYRSCPQL